MVVGCGAYASALVSKRTDSSGLGSLASGALTALSFLVVSVAAAATGIVIAREFGRSAETDGVLAAYGLSVVIAIAAQAIRIAVLPTLARARDEQRLAGELAGYGLALLVVAVPLVLAAELGAETLAEVLTGGESEVATSTAAEALRWMVPAGVAQLYAAVAVSGLAALDDYGTAAFGYAAGSVAGLALIVLRVEPDGISAVAWGVALNAAIVLVPAVALAVRAARERVPAAAVQDGVVVAWEALRLCDRRGARPRASLLYVVCLAFASRLDTGDATSFVYAYLAAAALVATTAGVLGIVTSVPLSRAGVDAEIVRHVVATSWLALAVVGAAAGAFAVAGGQLVESVLGDAYAEDVGADLGSLVVAFSPWVVASIGIGVTFPLAFVSGRTGRFPFIAPERSRIQAPLAWGAARARARGTGSCAGVDDSARASSAPRRARRARGGGTALATATLAVVSLALAAFVPAAF